MENPVLVFMLIPVLVRISTDFHFFRQRQGVLCGKDAIQFRLGALPGIALQHSGQVSRQLVRVVADHVQVITVLVIPWVAALDVVNLGLQLSFFGGIVGLHRQKFRVIGGIGAARHHGADALSQHRTGRNGVHQEADHQKEGQHNTEPFLVTHDKRPGLLRLFLNGFRGLAGFAGSFGSSSGSLTGALGGGILLFNGLFLLPAGKRIAGKLGIVPQGLPVQGVYIGFFQLLLRLCRLAVRFQLVAAVALPHQPCAGLDSFLGLVGAFHAHIVLFRLPDFLVNFPQRRITGSIPHCMGQLGGRLFLIFQHQLSRDLAGLRVDGSSPHLLFWDFCLRLVCFCGGPVCLAYRLFQRRVRAFLVCKAQARLLIHTISPA